MYQRRLAKRQWVYGLLGLGMLVMTQAVFAEGRCTGDLMAKLIQKGFSQAEIQSMCGSQVEQGKATSPVTKWVIGNWNCPVSNGKIVVHFKADGTFQQDDTLQVDGTMIKFTRWGTYTVESRGGNTVEIKATAKGSNHPGPLPPPQTNLVEMKDRNTMGDYCKRI